MGGQGEVGTRGGGGVINVVCKHLEIRDIDVMIPAHVLPV